MIDLVHFEWRIEERWLISPLGTRVAKFEGGALRLYDKHAKTDFPFTAADFAKLAGQAATGSVGDASSGNTDPVVDSKL